MQIDSTRGHLWAVILAGGDGVRLRELARQFSGDSRPKQFCRFFGDKSLLTHTRERIAPLIPAEQTFFALTHAHEAYYCADLPDVVHSRRVVQPTNRGTAVAITLCLQTIVREDADAIVAFFPSDHHYLDNEAFRTYVYEGLRVAEEYPNSIFTLGEEARYPEVEYGWIQPGRALTDSATNRLHRVSRFWEKPPLRQAMLLQRRRCLWNTFVMIGLASAFLEILEATVPQLVRSLRTGDFGGELAETYRDISAADFSRDVLARVPDRILVLCGESLGWTDLGTERRLLETLALTDGYRAGSSDLAGLPPVSAPGQRIVGRNVHYSPGPMAREE